MTHITRQHLAERAKCCYDWGMTEIKLYRDRLYPPVARRGPAWRWTYEYQVDDGPRIGYGTHLASLRDRLKRRYPGAVVRETWK